MNFSISPRRITIWLLITVSFHLALGADSPLSKTTADQLELVRHIYLEESAQVRISEYFTGNENPGRRQYIRTSPTSRSGYYFVVRLRSPLRQNPLPSEGRFEIELYRRDSINPLLYRFPLDQGMKPRAPFYLGITDQDWPEKDARPIAWQIRLLNQQDQVIGTWSSLLWETPREIP